MLYQFIVWSLLVPSVFACRNSRKRERVEEYDSDEEILEFKYPRRETQMTTWKQPTPTQLLAHQLMIPALADFDEHPDLKVFSGLQFERSDAGKISSLLYFKHILRSSLGSSALHDRLQSIFFDEMVSMACEQSELFAENAGAFGLQSDIMAHFSLRGMFLDFIKEERVDKIVRYITCTGGYLDILDVFSTPTADVKNFNKVLSSLAKHFQSHPNDFSKVIKSISAESIAVLLPAQLTPKDFLTIVAGNEQVYWDDDMASTFLSHFRRLCQLDLSSFPEIETFGPKLQAIIAEIQSQMNEDDLEELELEFPDALLIINERFSPASTMASLEYPEYQQELDVARLHGKKYMTLLSNLPEEPSIEFKKFLAKDQKFSEVLSRRAVSWIRTHFRGCEALLSSDANLIAAYYGGQSGTWQEFFSPERTSQSVTFYLPHPTVTQQISVFMKPYLETATREQFQVFIEQLHGIHYPILYQKLLTVDMPFAKRLDFLLIFSRKINHWFLDSASERSFAEITDPQLLIDLISNDFTFSLVRMRHFGVTLRLDNYKHTLLKVINNDGMYAKLLDNLDRLTFLFPCALERELLKARSPLEFERIYEVKTRVGDRLLLLGAFKAHAFLMSFHQSPSGVYDKSLYMMSFMQAWLSIDMRECAQDVPRDLEVVISWFDRFLEKLAESSQKQLLLDLIPNLSPRRRMALATVWYKLHLENQKRCSTFEPSSFY